MLSLLFFFIFSLINIISVILAVAFFTLSERKVMASVQRRRGPDVVGWLGLLQPFADAVKLIVKESSTPNKSTSYMFLLAPMVAFVFNIVSWIVIPFSFYAVKVDSELTLLFLFPMSALSAYGVLLAGWASGSKYALLGAFRSVAQMLAYELVLSVSIIPVVYCAKSLNLLTIVLAQQNSVWYIMPLFISAYIFFIAMLAETNRAPFDLPEAEAELVAGFNVEYSSISFALFFLGEYSAMILMSFLWVLLFLGGWTLFGVTSPDNILFFNNFAYHIISGIILAVKVIFICFMYIYVRANLPRYRYDQLMFLGWKVLLPLALAGVLLSHVLIMFFKSINKFWEPGFFIL